MQAPFRIPGRRLAWVARIRCSLMAALLVLGGGGAYADDSPLQRASELRNAAAEDWNQKAYAEAVKKLRAALEIYDHVDGERPLDRAISQRALIWNLVRVGEHAEILQPYEALMDLAAADDSVYPEVTSAWSAVWEAASSCSTFAAGEALLASVAEAAEKRSLGLLRGQALHSLGSLAVRHKQTALVPGYYGQAITLRRETGDAVGEAWSVNNLANFHLLRGDVIPALELLRAGYVLLHRERIAEPQQAVAWNLKKALAMFREKPEERAVPWLRSLREVSAGSLYGTVVPASHLDREALRIAQQLGQQADVLALAKALAQQPVQSAVPELQADLTIRAALAAAQAGKSEQARAWLQNLDVGTGPCREHLEARRKTALAVALASEREKKRFPAAARDAAAAWRDLGDFAGRREALGALVAAAHAAGLEGSIPQVGKEAGEAHRAGGPGGDGGSASSAGDRSKAGDVALEGAVFYVSMDGDQVHIEDRVANHEIKRALRWKPARLGVNGLSITLFGGYLVVESMNYGGATTAPAAPGATTLDELGIYMPIPGRGALIIQKNGAVRYEAPLASPR